MPAHRWTFFRAGGFDQVQLDTGADLLNLGQLDQTLWVALACPTTGLEFSPRTAALIDTDHDGRIRAPELIAAVKWTGAMLANPDDLVKGGDTLAFSAIANPTLKAAARRICAVIGKPDATAITLADVTGADQIFAATRLNGDGIVLPESAEDDATRTVITEIAARMGTVTDRSGKPGIDQAKLDAFFAECAKFDEWHRGAEADGTSVLPAGAGTAAGAVRAVRSKVDDYFGRCRLAAFDPRAAALLNRKEEEYLAVAAHDLSITAAEIAGFPLAQVAAGRPLPLDSGLNPAHAAAVAALRAQAVTPLLGDRSELSEAEWLALQAKLAAYERWSGVRAGVAVEALGLERVREILGNGAREAVATVIAEDKALAAEAAAIGDVEKLLLFQRDLHLLCVNFVSFRDFYDKGEP